MCWATLYLLIHISSLSKHLTHEGVSALIKQAKAIGQQRKYAEEHTDSVAERPRVSVE